MTSINEALVKKWAPVLDYEGLPKIAGSHRKIVTAHMLENTQRELGKTSGYTPQTLLGEDAPTNHTGAQIDNFDPVLISLIRRSTPNLIHFDVMGVQSMTGPTGLVFAMRSRYVSQTGAEAFYNEANTAFATVVTGANTIGQKHVGTLPGGSNTAANGEYNYGTGASTAQLEAFGTSGNTAIPEMAFDIDKVQVTATGRKLKAEYSIELAQDLKAVHGLDAETELANILSTELISEINREAIRTIYVSAKPGAAVGTTNAGIFDLDTDSNGRWSLEKYKGLIMQIEREANAIGKATRRGKGNILIVSSDVASAIAMSGQLSNVPGVSTNLDVDDTGNTFAGVLNNKFKVYIDPYVTGDYAVVGYKGVNSFDAGLFYCPYVPLQMSRAVDPGSFQPKIGFQARYGMVANPFAEGATNGSGVISADSNNYYRKFKVVNIL